MDTVSINLLKPYECVYLIMKYLLHIKVTLNLNTQCMLLENPTKHKNIGGLYSYLDESGYKTQSGKTFYF